MKLPTLTPVEGSAPQIIIQNGHSHDLQTAKRQPTRQCTLRIKETTSTDATQEDTKVNEKDRKRKSRTSTQRKRQAPPTYRISIKGEPQYFLEPTFNAGTMFLGLSDSNKILGLLTDGEIVTSGNLEKIYFLSKVGLMPAENKHEL